MPAVIVIGAGAVGASVAYRLAAGGAAVTLVEAGQPGGGTSARSFAWLNANRKPPEPYHRLNAEGVEAHRRLRDALGRGPWLHETGNLVFAPGGRPAAALEERVGRLRALDYPAEMIGHARAAELEPAVAFPDAGAVAWFPREAWADGPLLAATLVEAARALGAGVRSGRAARILDASGDVARVELPASSDGPAETLEADLVVVAAGRWSDQVAASVGARVPLAPTSGLLAVTSPLANGPSRVAHLPGVHLRPDGRGRLVLQDDDTDAQVGPETPERPDLPGCRLLLERARAFVPALADARVEAARVGTRALPADGYPIVGPAPEAARLYLAVSHSGMTLGPLLGEIVAAELLTGQPDPRLATFRPGRDSLAAPARP